MNALQKLTLGGSLFSLLFLSLSHAQEPPDSAKPLESSKPAAAAEDTDSSPRDESHPLAVARRWLEEGRRYAERDLDEYVCTLIKRERIAGELQPRHYVRSGVRKVGEDQVGSARKGPEIFLEYLAPEMLKGQRVVARGDVADGNLLVQLGGDSEVQRTLRVGTDGVIPALETRHAPLDFALHNVIANLMRTVDRAILKDPESENTKVTYYKDAKVGVRNCRHFQIVHPARQSGFDDHVLDVYLDDINLLPIHIARYNWPEREGQQPPLQEEITYTRLLLNVGVTSEDFRIQEQSVTDAAENRSSAPVID